MKIAESDVKKFAVENGLKVYQPEKVKGNEEFIETIRNINPDIICVVAYGKILPKEILDIPRLGCINLHGSLLPKYRGAAPIQWAVLNGDKKTGVTTIYMNEKMDAGDIIYQEETDIKEYETTGELWDRLKDIGADLLVKTVKDIENGVASRKKQEGEVTIAPMLDKTMAKLDFSTSAEEIKNKVCGLNPIMGAYAIYEGKKIKFWKVKVLDDIELSEFIENNASAISGEVLASNPKTGLYIKAGKGAICVLEIQGENSKRMSIGDFLRGNKIEVGIKFE